MKLMYAQGERFFKLFDMLTVYAHQRLHVVDDDEFFTGEPPRGLSQDGQRLTARELWETPDIIDDFVAENPGKLDKRELDIVRSWKDAYTALAFFNRCPDGHVRAFLDDYVVDVCGMGIDFDDMLADLPVIAWITLLPFEGFIVYDTTIEELPLAKAQAQTMFDVFAGEMAEALAEGRVLHTGYQLSAVVPELNKRRLDAKMEQFRHEMEMEERAAGPHKGQHRGKLAGIHGEERDRLVRDHMRRIDHMSQDVLGMIEGQCLPGEPVFGLRELLEADKGVPGSEEFTSKAVDRFDMQLAGLIEEARRDPGMDQDELEAMLREVDEARRMISQADPIEIIERRVTTPELLQDQLSTVARRQLEKLRKLADAGGHLTFPHEENPSFLTVPAPQRGVCYLFSTDGAIHAVMPREVVPVAQQVDWDEACKFDDETKRFASFVECVLDLRGITEVGQMIEEYRSAWDSDWPADELYGELLDGLDTERICGTILDTGEKEYLLHDEVALIHHEAMGRNPHDKQWSDSYVLEEPLDDSLRGLVAQQRGKEPRPVSEDMLKAESAFSWRMKQPPVLALLDYLDEHVPDDVDDYFFAEGVIEEVLVVQQYGVNKEGIQEFFAILKDYGFVPDESQVPELLRLWQNLCNGLPIWPNNGWSPNDLAGRELGKPVFFNPDGSVKKVGRNDPCPCGSEKKYKNCCGR